MTTVMVELVVLQIIIHVARGKDLHKTPRTLNSSLVATIIVTQAMATTPILLTTTTLIPPTTTTLAATAVAVATTTTLVEDADVLLSPGLTTMEM